MASVFKRKRRVTRNGRTVVVEAKKYTVQYSGADGKVHRQTAYTDRERSWTLAVKLERDAQSGEHAKHRKTPLSAHLDVFRRQLKEKERTAKHVRITCNRIAKVFQGCGFVRLADVAVSEIEEWLAEERELGIGIQTRNYYVAALKQFFSWMVKSKRAASSPVVDLEKLNAETDVRRVRRVLGPDELPRLIDAAQHGEPFRAVLYLLAVRTGLRASECASLTAESFDLTGRTVTVQAAYSKRRRTDTLPLRSDLARLLVEWLSGRTGPLWPGTWLERSARMIRRDLEAAGIPYETAEGVFDFHGLRHQFISDLARSGVHPKVAQELARHSTIALTMDRYSHVLSQQKVDALETLPALPLTQDLTQPIAPTCPETAQPVTKGGGVSVPIPTTEPLGASGVGTACPDLSPDDPSSGAGTRTPDTRIMIPLL